MSVSIRSRLLLLVLSVLLPGVAAAMWMIQQTYQVERRAIEHNLRDTTRALSLVVDHELTRRAVIARVLALSRALDDAPLVGPAQRDAFDQQARREMQGYGGWVELRAADRQLLTTRVASTASTPATTAAPNATPIALLTQPNAGDAASTSGAAAAIAPPALADRPRIGALERWGGGSGLHVGVVQPVQREGRTLLNVKVTVLPVEMQSIVDHQRLPGNWISSVIDGRGTIVARHPGGAAYAGRSVTPDLKAKMAAAPEALFESVSLDGVPTVGYYATSPQGWTYLMAVPRGEFAGWLPAAVLQVALGALLLLALAVAGALWVSRRIVGPVVSLKIAAARMQAGLPVEQTASGIVECDEVGAALAQAGKAMQQARADLERQVADAVARTREAEQRVSRNQRVEALGRLTGGVAHDFNNLLGVISNSAHLIGRQGTDPALQAPVAATLRAVETGSRLTRQLLRFSGSQPVHPQSLDLARHLPEVQELLKTVLGRRIAVSVWVAPNTRSISVDANELELSLINLALNARDAMPAGGELWVKARNAEPHDSAGMPAGDYVLITVSDDGVGMAEGLAERVFEPFFTTKAVGEGNGLGLSQVHGFCQQAGGVARVASTQGLGTTISMVLPARNANSAAPAGLQTQRSDDGVTGRRVLLVEDNEELGNVTAALLESYGCDVQRARSAYEALSRIAGVAAGGAVGPASSSVAGAEHFDVVLSDVVMPGGLDGVGLARALREHFPSLPVVLISGYSSAPAAARDFTVLHKPCAPEEVVATLRRAIEARPAD